MTGIPAWVEPIRQQVHTFLVQRGLVLPATAPGPGLQETERDLILLVIQPAMLHLITAAMEATSKRASLALCGAVNTDDGLSAGYTPAGVRLCMSLGVLWPGAVHLQRLSGWLTLAAPEVRRLRDLLTAYLDEYDPDGGGGA